MRTIRISRNIEKNNVFDNCGYFVRSKNYKTDFQK